MRPLWILIPALGLGACAHVESTSSPTASQTLENAQMSAAGQLSGQQATSTTVVSGQPASARDGSPGTSKVRGEDIAALAQTQANTAPVKSGDDTMWKQLRPGFGISEIDRAEVDYWREYYSQRPKLITAIFERARPFLYPVSQEVKARNLPMELALLPAIESGFHPFAYSRSHASGLWQFIPLTAGRFGLSADDWMDRRRDVASSTNAALDYLSYLNKFFDGDWYLAIAAYNAGEGRVRSAVRKNAAAGLPTDFWSLDLPKETRDYVPRLLGLAQLVKDPVFCGITLPDIPAKEMIAAVPIQESLDLGVAATLLQMPVDELKRLNPGLRQFSTPPDREFQLAIPKDKLKDFTTALAELAPEDKAPWERHVLAKGETLASVAKRYGMDVEQLKKQNPRERKTFRAGETLLVRQGPVRYPSSFLASLPGQTGERANPGNAGQTARNPLLASSETPERVSAGFLSRLLHGKTRTTTSLIADASDSAPSKSPSKVREVVVKAGETLYRIAQNANVSLEDLRRWNRLDPDQPIRAGQRLVVADSNTGFGAIAAPRATAGSGNDGRFPGQSMPRKQVTYVVQIGDTLWSIARRFNVAFHELLTWNRISEKWQLRPGDSIIVYLDK
ncbi:lytic transglycosylase [Thermithiobacillus plumbiphilus]|uniref:LysM peptidoglycan-binding domain-containing protein n=1 Tax=Thermithiobacillus plumbiphilus TaxID=1729899 RepID=A0ABU9D972_9PROT